MKTQETLRVKIEFWQPVARERLTKVHGGRFQVGIELSGGVQPSLRRNRVAKATIPFMRHF